MARNMAEDLLREGLAHHQAGRFAQASRCYDQLRRINPKSWEGFHYGGMAALSLNAHRDALALFAEAVRLAPRAADSQMALGLTALALGNIEMARGALEKTTQLNPKQAVAWDNLGLVLRMATRFKEAIECHEKAVKLAPTSAAAWYAFGATLLETEAVSRALQCFDKALSLEPRNLGAREGRALALFRMHALGESIQEYLQILKADPKKHTVRSAYVYALNSLPSISKEDLFQAHVEYGRQVGPPIRLMPRSGTAAPAKLKVGLLSPCFRTHSVAYFVAPLLRHVDRERFEIHLFQDDGRVDAMSDELKSLCNAWHMVAGNPDTELETKILGAKLDVLIELCGHTAGNRLSCLARRLAPTQITYLAYPNTTGVPAIDYRFVDDISDPVGVADTLNTEKLVRFSSVAWCYEAPSAAPEPAPAPRTRKDQITFGCFSNFSKTSVELFREWAQLMREVPNSRLLIKSPGLDQAVVSERIRLEMKSAGLDLDRIQFLGQTPGVHAHLEMYHDVDFTLDTYPYHGTTTTCESLWMGVPVVVLAGDRHASRVGASLLHAIGKDDWVVESWDAYRAKIQELLVPQSPEESLAARMDLRERMKRSPLMDHRGQAQRFWGGIGTIALGPS